MIVVTVNDFEKVVDYNDIRYDGPEDDRFNAAKKPSWYIRSCAYDGPIVSEPSRIVYGVVKN